MTTATSDESAAARLHAELWSEPGRRKLVRLCAAVSRDREAAEDLAQETLLEAWRNLHKLHDPTGADRWLAAIARHVCRRWARRRGRDLAFLEAAGGAGAAGGELDVELELERGELAELLDRALTLLPPETRDVLVRRYVHESSHAEIGARLGLSDDAVSMRLTRGKAVLRRLLASELADEASTYGLVDASDAGWRETRIWCPDCGRRKLAALRQPAPGVVAFRCPDCNGDAPGSSYPLGNPVFAELVGDLVRPAAIVARAAGWSSQYFEAGAGAGGVACTRCGRPVTLARYRWHHRGAERHGLLARCTACGEQVSSSIGGLALALPEVRAFRREHPRTTAVPAREVEAQGVPAIVVRYEALLGSAGVDVVLARETLRVLHVATG